MLKRVSFKQYQTLKVIYKNIAILTANDTEAIIVIRK